MLSPHTDEGGVDSGIDALHELVEAEKAWRGHVQGCNVSCRLSYILMCSFLSLVVQQVVALCLMY